MPTVEDNGARLIFSDQERTPARMRDFFNNVAPSAVAEWPHEAGDKSDFVRRARLKPNHVVLDLGTGVGCIAMLASRKCALSIGLDISPEMVRLADGWANRTWNNNTEDRRKLFFEEADITDPRQVQHALTRVRTQPGVREAWTEAQGGCTALRFDTVYLHETINLLPKNRQGVVFSMIFDQLLRPYGQLVLDYQPLPSIIATSNLRLRIEMVGGEIRYETWCGSMIAGRSWVKAAKQQVMQLVWTDQAERHPMVSCHAYPANTCRRERRYEDRTGVILSMARDGFNVEAPTPEQFQESRVQFVDLLGQAPEAQLRCKKLTEDPQVASYTVEAVARPATVVAIFVRRGGF